VRQKPAQNSTTGSQSHTESVVDWSKLADEMQEYADNHDSKNFCYMLCDEHMELSPAPHTALNLLMAIRQPSSL